MIAGANTATNADPVDEEDRFTTDRRHSSVD
jgi:hypothetical protein